MSTDYFAQYLKYCDSDYENENCHGDDYYAVMIIMNIIFYLIGFRNKNFYLCMP